MIFDHAVDNCSLCLETSCTADEHFIWKDSFEDSTPLFFTIQSMSFFKHVQLHKYDITDKGISQACYDEMKADGYDIVITEKEMQVLAKHRCEEFKEYMRPLFA